MKEIVKGGTSSKFGRTAKLTDFIRTGLGKVRRLIARVRPCRGPGDFVRGGLKKLKRERGPREISFQ